MNWLADVYIDLNFVYGIPNCKLSVLLNPHNLADSYFPLHESSIQSIYRKIIGSENMNNYIFFHKPEEENGYLSNWYKCDVESFSTSEHYLMWRKAMLFGDIEIAEKIKQAKTPAEAKQLGRKIKSFNDEIWISNREIIMFEVNYAKFSKNEDLKQLLLKTGNAILAECAVQDKIWGIGLAMNDSTRFYQSKWRGQNLLGRTLMSVRATLQCESQ